MNKFDFTPWRKALAVEVNKNKEDNYPYAKMFLHQKALN